MKEACCWRSYVRSDTIQIGGVCLCVLSVLAGAKLVVAREHAVSLLLYVVCGSLSVRKTMGIV